MVTLEHGSLTHWTIKKGSCLQYMTIATTPSCSVLDSNADKVGFNLRTIVSVI